ncbi:MAG: 4-hydroxy-tetrahydrodipicolinate reductase [Phycisphaerales bacterium]|jgi:4-hydroxy-tetrahydrodipicolinate reductase
MSAAPVRVAIHGARGRMGERLCALVRADRRFVLAAEIDRDLPPPPALFAGDGASLPTPRMLDAIIDFSSPDGAATAADLALCSGAALLVGTTGLDTAQRARLAHVATVCATMLAPNTSLGVAVLRHLVREASRLLPGFEIDIVESHHIRKKDAPSGTALALAAASAEVGRPVPPERIHALRGGDIVGEHTVQFAGPGETIQLSHSAVSRDLFALGALRAAAWLAGQRPGLYTIEDSLGLPRP